MGLRSPVPHQAWWCSMTDFSVEDISNIALLCFVLGVGFITFVAVSLLYLASLFLMESLNDRD
jgi:hypothetical protein